MKLKNKKFDIFVYIPLHAILGSSDINETPAIIKAYKSKLDKFCIKLAVSMRVMM